MTVRLCACFLTGDQKGSREIVLREAKHSGGKSRVEIPFSLEETTEDGFLFLSLDAEKDGIFFGAEITAEMPPLRAVKVGIVTTTFRREECVKENLRLLADALPQKEFSLFVVDNGNTLNHEEVAGATLINNPNLGGSGGFARGILEVTARSDFTHLLLCDDDVNFHPEIFLRTAAFLRYAKEPDRLILGASMLDSDKPWSQHEAGAILTKRGVRGVNAKEDLRDRSVLLKNAAHPPLDYTAWWFCCFSVSLVRRIGLPFPFFIKLDDVEYALRANAKVLVMNGVGLWHQNFAHKESGALAYYALRNELILRALQPSRGGLLGDLSLILRAVGRALVFYRYADLPLLFRAVEDYLKGGEYFASLDGQKLHKELLAAEQKPLSFEKLISLGYDLSAPVFHPADPSALHKILRILTLNGYLLPASKKSRLIERTTQTPEAFFRAGEVLVCDEVTKTGTPTKRKGGELLKAAARLFLVFFKLLFKRRKAARSFRALFPLLVSKKEWENRFHS